MGADAGAGRRQGLGHALGGLGGPPFAQVQGGDIAPGLGGTILVLLVAVGSERLLKAGQGLGGPPEMLVRQADAVQHLRLMVKEVILV